jgi:hypothetical protein
MTNDDNLLLSGTTILLRVFAVIALLGGILLSVLEFKASSNLEGALSETTFIAGVEASLSGIGSCLFLWVVAQIADRVAAIDRSVKNRP